MKRIERERMETTLNFRDGKVELRGKTKFVILKTNFDNNSIEIFETYYKSKKDHITSCDFSKDNVRTLVERYKNFELVNYIASVI